MRVDDDKESRDDALENLFRSFKNFQRSVEHRAARIHCSQGRRRPRDRSPPVGLTDVQAELAAVKTVTVPVDASSAIHIAKEAREARILAGVSQKIDVAEMAEGSVFLRRRSLKTWSSLT